jgi:hypothetical protein
VKPFVFHPEADEEFLEALAYHARESETLGRRFYHAIHKLVSDVCGTPKIYRHMPLAPEVQRHFGRPFPYAVLYVEESNHILILAIAHFKRRPGYWLHRLKSR